MMPAHPRLASNQPAGHQPPRNSGWCTPRAAVRTRPTTPLDNSRCEEYIYGYHDTTTADGDQPDKAVRESRGGGLLKPPTDGRCPHARRRGDPQAHGALAEPI